MTHEKVLAGLAECERLIRTSTVAEPCRLDAGAKFISRNNALPHCLSLCIEAQTWTEERREKAMRWLCWIQGVLWTLIDVDIATLKDMNKP